MVALFLCEAVVSSGLLCGGDTADCAYSVQCHSFLVLIVYLVSCLVLCFSKWCSVCVPCIHYIMGTKCTH